MKQKIIVAMAFIAAGTLTGYAYLSQKNEEQGPVQAGAVKEARHTDNVPAQSVSSPPDNLDARLSQLGAKPIESKDNDAARAPSSIELQPYADNEFKTVFLRFNTLAQTQNALNEEESMLFLGRLAVTIERSSYAQQEISDLYRSMPDARNRIVELLSAYAANGPELLLREADYHFSVGGAENYHAAFGFYAKYAKEVDAGVIEEAIQFSNKNKDEPSAALSAMSVLAKVSADEKTPDIYRETTVGALKSLAQSSTHDMVRVMAVRNLYFSTPPAESAAIAESYLERHPDSQLGFFETLHAIERGEIENNSHLHAMLEAAAGGFDSATLSEHQLNLMHRVLQPKHN